MFSSRLSPRFLHCRTRATLILFALAVLTIGAIKLHFILGSQVPYAYTTECSCAACSYRLRTVAVLRARGQPPPWAALLALGCALLCYCRFAPWFAPFMVGPPLLAFSVNHIQHSWKWLVAVFEWRPLRQLGILSYSVYLGSRYST